MIFGRRCYLNNVYSSGNAWTQPWPRKIVVRIEFPIENHILLCCRIMLFFIWKKKKQFVLDLDRGDDGRIAKDGVEYFFIFRVFISESIENFTCAFLIYNNSKISLKRKTNDKEQYYLRSRFVIYYAFKCILYVIKKLTFLILLK